MISSRTSGNKPGQHRLKMILIIGLLASLVICLLQLHNFLAITRPVRAEVLVVEGWLFDYMLDQAAEEFKTGNYQLLITTGCRDQFQNLPERGGFAGHAEYAAAYLAGRGIDPGRIMTVPAPDVKNHRTYQAGLALKKWLAGHPGIHAINIYTGGPHARKTYTIFRRVIGRAMDTGVIACTMTHYNPRYWWGSARGVSVTLRFFIGYLYALCWPFNTDTD